MFDSLWVKIHMHRHIVLDSCFSLLHYTGARSNAHRIYQSLHYTNMSSSECKLDLERLAAQYRRTREINNKASFKFRNKQRANQAKLVADLQSLTDLNKTLKDKKDTLEREISQIKQVLNTLDIP